VGLRYTKDDKDFGILVPEPDSYLGPYFTYGFATAEYIEDSKSWSDTTTRFALTWAPSDDAIVFANYTQGFKSGASAASGYKIRKETHPLTKQA
jgi:iron complex outermembrane receptor protein